MNEGQKLQLLLVGHLSSHPSGSSLLFRQLVEHLYERDDVKSQVINTVRPRLLTSNMFVNAWVALRTTLAALRQLPKADVVTFHASQPAMMSYAPILVTLSRFFRRPIVLRLFGGTLEREYESLPGIRKWLFDRTILEADLLLLETKHLVTYFARAGARNAQWYSNSRPLAQLPTDGIQHRQKCSRFVFLGRVVEEKGIDVMLQTASALNPGISLDIFGPMDGSYTADMIDSAGKGVIRYKGVLSFEHVHVELLNYDALVLPTFYRGEGYPGVILEAYGCGLPVITTNWRAIPEIVDENTGILIPIRSPEALAEAMNNLQNDPVLYARLCEGALLKRLEFSEQIWTDRFVDWCVGLAQRGNQPEQ